MKKLDVDFSQLQRLARMIGDGNADFRLEGQQGEFTGVDLDVSLGGEGIEIDLDAIDSDFNLLSYQGRQVLLYIKDHSNKFDATLQDPQKGNRFHIAHCSTLEDMRQKNRFQRYVATNRVSGMFDIEDQRGWGGGRRAEAELVVCMNCLSKLNYRGSVDFAVRRQVVQQFALTEFFSDYSSCFLYMPKAWNETTSLGYTHDWPEISKAIRAQVGYVCSECHVDLSRHHHLCHVHHINRVKTDNSPENLRVLCKDCHRRQPRHEGIYVSHTEMQIITDLRRKAGVLDAGGWDDAFSLSDPAVHGDLQLLQRKGYPAPVIGHEVQGAGGEVIAEIEAAWPEKREGIAIDSVTVPGWTIWRVGDICAAG